MDNSRQPAYAGHRAAPTRGGKIDPHDLAMVAFGTDPVARARDAVIAVDTQMQANYAALKAELINQLSPVIVVNNDPRGGEYTLGHDGGHESLHPVSAIFELAKSVSHTPLGIFSIIAPYLRDSETTDWIAPLSTFGQTLRTARQALDEAGIPSELAASCTRVLDGGVRFIDKSLDLGYFSIRSFETFSGSVYDSIRTNMRYASEAQIAGVQELLARWRKQIGERGWRELYTVVISMWTTQVLNQNTIIIRPLMDPANVDSHLIDLSAAEPPADPVFTALDNLARIVQDNVAAQLVFPTDQEIADALKGTEDLLSETILQLLDCPYQSVRQSGGAAAPSEYEQTRSALLS